MADLKLGERGKQAQKPGSPFSSGDGSCWVGFPWDLRMEAGLHVDFPGLVTSIVSGLV